MKRIAQILLFVISLNIILAPANATTKTDDLESIFGSSVYICSADNSFDLGISDYEKLLYLSYENNQHEKFFSQGLELVGTDIFEINYLQSNSIILLGVKEFSFQNKAENSKHSPRAPPYSFV